MYPSALPWQLKAPCQSVMTAKAGTGHQRRLWNFQHRAEEGTNTCQSGFGMLIFALLCFGKDTTSSLEVPSSPQSQAKSETMQQDFDCENKWDPPPSPRVCWAAVLKQHPFLSSLDYCLLLVCQLPQLTWGLSHCDAFPTRFCFQKCCFFMLFSFLSGELQWRWNFREAEISEKWNQ